MDPDYLPGPSGEQKRLKITFEDPKEITEEEMLAYSSLSDSEDSLDFDNYSSDDKLYQVSESGDSDSEDDFGSDNLPILPVINDIIWSDPPLVNRRQLPFLGTASLKEQPAGNNPLDYFNMLVDHKFYDIIVEQSNLYAEEIFLASGTVRPRISEWKTLTAEELRVFLGLILHMGNIRINRIQDYWSKHPLFNLKCFSYYMGRNRFMMILRCMHFARNPTVGEVHPTDKLYKIGPIIDYFNEKMMKVYSPSRELSIDESLLSWRGRLSFRQPLPGKRHKCGVKFYVLAEPNGLTMKLMIYAGADDVMSGVGHAASVVLLLMHDHLDKGHALFLDNFYNSHYLASTLLQRKTFCTGTLRVKWKGNCVDVMEKKLHKGEVIEKCDEVNGVIMGKWHDKRDVTFISTEFSGTLVEVRRKRGGLVSEPQAIVEYDKYMAAVDRKDEILSYNTYDRKTLRWYKEAGIQVLQILLFNSWILYNKYSGNRLSFYDFRISIIDVLLPKPAAIIAQPVSATVHLPSELPKSDGKVQRKDCRICRNKNKIRKMTKYCCNVCTGNPGLCLEPCFKIWHEQ